MAVFLVSCVDDSRKAAEVHEGDETPGEGVFGNSLRWCRAVGGGIASGTQSFVADSDALIVDHMV